jgi:hypothetical protein
MSEWKPGEVFVEVTKLLVGAAVAGSVAFYTERMHDAQHREDSVRQSAQLEQQLKEQDRRILLDLVPRVAGAGSSKDNCAWVISLWQDAKGSVVLPEIISSACTGQKTEPAQARGHFAVLAGFDSDEGAGCTEVRKARKMGLEPAQLFKSGAAYRTVVGSFDTFAAAQQFAITVRDKLRPDAIAIDIDHWFTGLGPLECK